MRIFLLFLFIGILSSNVFSQTNFSVNLIADSLKKEADAVVRFCNETFEINDLDKTTHITHKAITILSSQAEELANFYEYTSKFGKLKDAAFRVYDASGKLLNAYTKKDLYKQSAGEGLVPDGYIYYQGTTITTYPITVEIYKEVERYSTAHLPSFDLGFKKIAIQNATFIVKTPVALPIRYKLKNTNQAPNIATESNKQVMQWTITNATSLAASANRIQKALPQIILAPNAFKMDDYSGDMSTWNSFGYWYKTMSETELEFDKPTEQLLKDITQKASNEKEKVKIVYAYLQQNFRYVAILLGIGGFKPLPASFTHQKKYGDCKGLSNYMQAALRVLNIKSYQALIRAGYNATSVDKNFPCNQFNHVIVCVPLEKDTIWLECTSKTNEFGVLGNFTENRYALLITENGGQLIATPKSEAVHNSLTTKNNITINKDGSTLIQATYTSKGEIKQELNSYFESSDRDVQRNILVNYFGYKAPVDFAINQKDTFKLDYDKYQDFSAGTKFFINAIPLKHSQVNLPIELLDEQYFFEYPFIKTDTTIYKLPEGAVIDGLPKPKNITIPFASFTTTYTVNTSEVKVISQMQLLTHTINPKEYVIAKDFFDKVIEAQKEKIVIKMAD